MFRLHHAARLGLGFAMLTAMLELGNAAARWLPLPGPLIGMILLFCFLTLPSCAASRAAAACGTHLLKHYAFFFIPAGVGVLAYIAPLRAAWFAIVMSLLISSIASTVISAAVMHLLTRRQAGAAIAPSASHG